MCNPGCKRFQLLDPQPGGNNFSECERRCNRAGQWKMAVPHSNGDFDCVAQHVGAAKAWIGIVLRPESSLWMGYADFYNTSGELRRFDYDVLENNTLGVGGQLVSFQNDIVWSSGWERMRCLCQEGRRCVIRFKVAQNETLFPKMWWFFLLKSSFIICW